ncbi:MAG: septum formation initiator family protein [Thermaerobacterales bacterium]
MALVRRRKRRDHQNRSPKGKVLRPFRLRQRAAGVGTPGVRDANRATNSALGALQRLRWDRLILITAAIYALVTFSAQEVQFARLRQDRHQLQEAISAYQTEIAAQEERVAFLDSPEFIEFEARHRFNLTRPGEIHYLMVRDDRAVAAETAPPGRD